MNAKINSNNDCIININNYSIDQYQENLNKDVLTLLFESTLKDIFKDNMTAKDRYQYTMKAIIYHKESPYKAVYNNFNIVKDTDVVPDHRENPWIFSYRNLNFPGEKISLPEKFHDYFAYGNGNFEDSPLIIIGDSDHTNSVLEENRIKMLMNEIIRDQDILLLEGLSDDTSFNAVINSKNILIRGLENQELFNKCVKNLKTDQYNRTEILDDRNDVFANVINNKLSNKYKQRIIVYLGEGHIVKQLIDKLNTNHYTILFDRYVIFDESKKMIRNCDEYFKKGSTKSSSIFSIMQSLGLKVVLSDDEQKRLLEKLKEKILKQYSKEEFNNIMAKLGLRGFEIDSKK